MKVTKGQFSGKTISLSKSFTNKDIIKIGGEKFALHTDIHKLEVIAQEKYRSAWTTFFLLLLGVTIIGLIIAIPAWMAMSKRVDTQLYIEFNTGFPLYVSADTREWKILKNYVTLQGQRAAI